MFDNFLAKIKEFFNEERKTKYKYMAFFSFFALIFGALEVLYQYYFLTGQNLQASLVRGFALAGATLLGSALLIGPVARLFPQYNFIALIV